MSKVIRCAGCGVEIPALHDASKLTLTVQSPGEPVLELEAYVDRPGCLNAAVSAAMGALLPRVLS